MIKRAILSPLFAFALLTLNIWESWSANRSLDASQPPGGVRVLSLEERLLHFQGEVVIGAGASIPEIIKTLEDGNQGRAASLGTEINATLKKVSHQILQSPEIKDNNESFRFTLRDKALIAARLGLWDRAMELIQEVKNLEGSPSEQLLDSLLLRIFSEERAGNISSITEEEEVLLSAELLEFSSFLNVKKEDGRIVLADKELETAKAAWKRFFIGICVICSVALLALLSFVTLLTLFLRGKLHSHFRIATFPSVLLIEIFALYLAVMAGAPKLLGFLISRGIVSNPLTGNIALILATILVIFWPLASGVSFRELRRAIGVALGGVRKVFRDIVVAPFFYLSGWVVLVVVLALYSYLLSYFNIDIAQGAHPIVPILLSSDDPRIPILIAVLATFIAPLTEEIMFRGVLYGYMRSYLSPKAAVPLSALTFAIVHPQGPVGIVPLMTIGMMLALLREWRGTLLAPIIAHGCVNGGTLLMLQLFFK